LSKFPTPGELPTFCYAAPTTASTRQIWSHRPQDTFEHRSQKIACRSHRASPQSWHRDVATSPHREGRKVSGLSRHSHQRSDLMVRATEPSLPAQALIAARVSFYP
jgi:hypothetical protein